MELGASVSEAILASAKLDEVLDSLRDISLVKIEDDACLLAYIFIISQCTMAFVANMTYSWGSCPEPW